MNPNLLNYLCELITKAPLQLVDAVTTADGTIQSGALVSPSGKRFPISSGIPRFLDFVPGVGDFLEKSIFCVMGDVPRIRAGSAWCFMKRRYQNTKLNTFDNFESYQYQHQKSDDKLRAWVWAIQPVMAKVANVDKYFMRPAPIGCTLRVSR